MKLGEILISEGIIDEGQLKKALEKQSENAGKRLGEILLEMELVSFDQLEAVLKKIQ